MIALLNNKNTPQLCQLNPVAAFLWLVPYTCLNSPGFNGLRGDNNIHKTPSLHRNNFSFKHHRLPLSIFRPQITFQIPIAQNQSFTPRR